MGFVVVRIVLDQSDYIRIDVDVVGVVSVSDFNILVYYQIAFIRTPTERF